MTFTRQKDKLFSLNDCSSMRGQDIFIILCLVPAFLGFASANCRCRSGASCCCSQYTANDPMESRYKSCPCLSESNTVTTSVDSVITLTCDSGMESSGGVCYTSRCQWRTPLGLCSNLWPDISYGQQCNVPGVTFLNTGSSCNIQVTVTSSHFGNWSCLSHPISDVYVDRITLTESSGITTKTAMLGIALPMGIVLAIVVVLVLVFFCCPGLCVCIPCCANRQKERLEGRGNQKQQDRRSRSRSRSREDSRVYDAVETGEWDGHPPNQGLQYSQVNVDRGEELPQRTAKKISNTATLDLGDRIRKASGIGQPVRR